jgi:hypothetical protein
LVRVTLAHPARSTGRKRENHFVVFNIAGTGLHKVVRIVKLDFDPADKSRPKDAKDPKAERAIIMDFKLRCPA